MLPQKYYKIEFSAAPKKFRAHEYRLDNYTYRFKYTKIDPCSCEICWQEEGSVTELKDGVETTYGAGHAKGFIHNELREVYSYDSIHHEFTLVFTLPKEAQPMTEEDLLTWVPRMGEAILPGIVQDAGYNQKLAALIKQAVRDYNSTNRSGKLRLSADLMEILALMTDYSLECAHAGQQQSGIKHRHCQAVQTYVAEHLRQKLSVAEIAAHIGVSHNYLSQLFSETMGSSLVNYINRQRIQTAQQLLSQYDVPLEQLADAVGIADPKYFCRLFKKYTGITVSEYKKRYR